MSYRKRSHRTFSLGLLAVAGLAFALASAPAIAADLDYGYGGEPSVLPEQKVEFGSGWYIRGDIAATTGLNVKANDLPYYGNRLGPSTASPTISSSQSNRPIYDGTIGGGYQLNKWFRTDVTIDFHQPVKNSTSGQSHPCITSTYLVKPGVEADQNALCTPTLTASLRNFSVMVNGYLDLGTWSIVTPYIGVGVGLSYGRADSYAAYVQNNGFSYANIQYTDALSGTTFTQNWDRGRSVQYYNPAFALMAGLAFDVYDHTKLDIGYRYLNLGKVLGQDLQSQEVRAGLRYMVDN